jgi:non-specific serine/threonine protein kinase
MPLEDTVAYALAEPHAGEQAAERPRSRTTRQAEKDAFGGLTRHEREVAALIGQGKSNRAIAGELVVGIRAVEAHVTRIMAKLGFSSRTQIAVWAVAAGLVEAVLPPAPHDDL